MKKIIFILLFPLLLIITFAVYLYISAIIEKDRTYYFPQIETYIKIYKPPFNKYGYVLFSKDSIFSFSENIDFVKIYKSETNCISFIFNPLIQDKFYVVDRFNNIQEINQVNFNTETINWEDSTFFEKHIIAGTRTYLLKEPYVDISVEGYLQSVYYSNYGEEPSLVQPVLPNL